MRNLIFLLAIVLVIGCGKTPRPFAEVFSEYESYKNGEVKEFLKAAFGMIPDADRPTDAIEFLKRFENKEPHLPIAFLAGTFETNMANHRRAVSGYLMNLYLVADCGRSDELKKMSIKGENYYEKLNKLYEEMERSAAYHNRTSDVPKDKPLKTDFTGESSYKKLIADAKTESDLISKLLDATDKSKAPPAKAAGK